MISKVTNRFVLFSAFYGWVVAFAVTLPAAEHASAQQFSKEDLEFFENRIRPVLVKHCVRCHGEDPEKLKGELYLTSRDGILRGGESGPVLVPGKPEESLILKAIRWENLEMPPKAKLPANVVADFEKWITLGAPDPRVGGNEVVSRGIDLTAGRKHWAFQQLKQVEPPPTTNADLPIHNEIDSFIAFDLEEAGLRPNEEADRRTLIRRLFFNLIGLPPTREEIRRFEKEPYEEVVDYLLDSPHFGERWARHWLDVARFAESNGYEVDKRRNGAFQFRDWVIRAFNADMPFDQFVRLQVAGDLLEPDNPDAHTATGFLVAGPFSYPKPKAEELIGRYDEIDDMVGTVGSAFLAQTVSCARCHDHKFEPIPQEDYYAMAAAFAKTDRKPVSMSLDESGKFAIKSIPAKQGKGQNKAPASAITSYVASEYRKEPVHFLVRGDPNNPKEVAKPGFLQVVIDSEAPRFAAEGVPPRVALADWLTNIDDGSGRLLARVIVNRLWHHHFGRGLVDTPNDFGTRGGRPSHPDLLDYLASKLIENEWRLKPIHRMILMSATWRQSSSSDSKREAIDVDNRLLWRQNVRRLDAEPLRDSLLAVAGMLDRKLYGEGTLDSKMKRRAIYFETKRNQLIPFLQTFNAPDSLTSIGKRNVTTVAPQALLMMNEPLVRESASKLEKRIKNERDPVASAYEITFGRLPSAQEKEDATKYVEQASLLDLCHALLISNEFVYVR